MEAGYDVLLVGRLRKNSIPLPQRSYKTHRMKLLFDKGALFYAEYNLRLFWFLLWRKADLYFSNDLDTLLPNYLISRLRGKEIIYDSHEYFTGVPELEGRSFVKSVWKKIERFCLPKVKKLLTVNESIAQLYADEYGVKMSVVRNVPRLPQLEKAKKREELGLPMDMRIVILQGAGINVDRGAEETVAAMKHLQDIVLLIIGSGDVVDNLKERVNTEGIGDKVIFKGRLPYVEMMQYTMNADLGITFDKDTNINYRYSLPNKLFDYIQAGIPVLASRLPEIEKVITKYEVGSFIDNHNPMHIADRITETLSSSQYQNWKSNTKTAATELNWEKEKTKLLSLVS